MKKKIIALAAAIAVLAVLLGIYYAKTAYDKKQAAEDTPDDGVETLELTGTKLTDCNEDDIKSIVLSSDDLVLNIEKKDAWVSADYPDYEYDETAMEGIVYCFTSLYAADTVDADGEDLEQYGLTQPQVTAVSTDKKGNTQTIYLGTTTPDGNYYYALVNDDPQVYIIDALRGKSLCSTYDSILDKKTAEVDKESVVKLEIKKKGEDDILVVFDSDNATSEEYHNTVGLAALTMKKPLENMLVYPYNLENEVLYNLAQVHIGTLVDCDPTDLSKYGLDDPYLQFYVEDLDGNAIDVKVGNEAPEFADDITTYYYAMFDDKPQVFTIDKRMSEPFEDARVIDFIQNFISLYKRSEVDSITVETASKDYIIELRAEGENDFTVDEDGTNRDNRNTYINDVLVEKPDFSAFYEELCGLAFDDIDENNTVSGEPDITITFNFLDGDKDTAEYYSYNDGFYSVKKGDNCSMLISKQAVTKVISTMERLAQG